MIEKYKLEEEKYSFSFVFQSQIFLSEQIESRSMPAPCSFRQVEEKHATKARLMIWSPRMDLLALANVQGEV